MDDGRTYISELPCGTRLGTHERDGGAIEIVAATDLEAARIGAQARCAVCKTPFSAQLRPVLSELIVR